MGKLIVGCGYLGVRLARSLTQQGDPVSGLVRSSESVGRLEQEGIQPLQLDLDRPSSVDIGLVGSDLYYLAPPPPRGRLESRVENLISCFGVWGSPRRVLYISTSGVYGDCSGAWVDERWPVRPQTDRARRRWDGERRFRAWREAGGGELVIVRVAGIYGPDRLPLERLRQGLPLVRGDQAPYSNRIHVDDLVKVCKAAMGRGADGEVYNASDGYPTTMTDYFTRLADLTGLPRPPLISMPEAAQRLSPGMMSYLRESRRLDNRKIREGLGVELDYPGLETGLPASLKEE